MSRPRVDVTCGPGVLGCLRAAGGLLCVLVVIAVVLVSEPVRHLAGVSTADELVQDGIYGIAALIVLARAALVQLKEPAGGVLPAHSARVRADRCGVVADALSVVPGWRDHGDDELVQVAVPPE